MDYKIDKSKYKKLLKIRLPNFPKAYICVEKEEDPKYPAHFHIISDHKKYDYYDHIITLFDAKYCYIEKEEWIVACYGLTKKQSKKLNIFLRKKFDKYTSNWEYIISEWANSSNYYFKSFYNISQPDYTKLDTRNILYGLHLSDPIKIGEYKEYEILVYKEESPQPHFHVKSKKRDISFALMIFDDGVYFDHYDGRRDKFSNLVECIEFDMWVNDYWEDIKDKYFELNSHHGWLEKDTFVKKINEQKKPSYKNLFAYYFVPAKHADIEL